jgi:hypothetical protein
MQPANGLTPLVLLIESGELKEFDVALLDGFVLQYLAGDAKEAHGNVGFGCLLPSMIA